MTALRKSAPTSERRALLAKVHLGAKDLGLDEETRRAILARITGHRSSADCDEDQLVQVLNEYRRLGWKPATPQQQIANRAPRRTPAKHPVAMKARAMWISLHQLGVVRDPSEAALESFGKRQLKVDRLQWADQAQGFRMIEALKQMAERAGWSQDLAMVKPDRQVWSLKARLVNAQLHKLGRPSVMNIGTLGERDLDKMARDLAPEVLWKATEGGAQD